MVTYFLVLVIPPAVAADCGGQGAYVLVCRCPQSRVPGVKGVILPLLVKKVILPFLTTIIFYWGPGGHFRRRPDPAIRRQCPPHGSLETFGGPQRHAIAHLKAGKMVIPNMSSVMLGKSILFYNFNICVTSGTIFSGRI